MPSSGSARAAMLFGLACWAAAVAQPSRAAPAGEETVVIDSMTPSGPEAFLGGDASAPPVAIHATLRLPDGAGRVPAVVLLHSAGGVAADRDLAWAELLREAGIATLVLDSFGPRGVTGFNNQPPLFAGVADAFAALRRLRDHPRIDPGRVAVMGFSRGGAIALAAALRPVSERGSAGGPGFAAHVALYPGCATQYRAASVTAAPILLLLAGADEQAAPGPCRDHAAWLRARGAAIRVEEFAGAHHLFDGTEPLRLIAGAGSVGECSVVHDLDTGERRIAGAAEPSGREAVNAHLRGCFRRGVRIGGDAEARRVARELVPAFLREAFGSPASSR
jgi:dienelactone hydrolase